MRRNKHEIIKRARERNRLRGMRSQAVRRNDRLAAAVESLPIRPAGSVLWFELATRNPRTGQLHLIELWHEPNNGTDRLNVYLDDERWRNGWSRSRFAAWVFRQIDSVRADWE